MISPNQIKAARALLDWSQGDLCEKSGASIATVKSIESGGASPKADTLEKIKRCMEVSGIEFIEDEGVKKVSLKTRTYIGRSGFIEFMDSVYMTARDVGGEFCVSNVNEDLFTQHMGQEADDAYTLNMMKIKNNYQFRILIKEGDTNFVASSYAQYRWIPEEEFITVPFYVYGDNIAFILFNHGDVKVHVIHSRDIADAQRIQFNLAWDRAGEPHV